MAQEALDVLAAEVRRVTLAVENDVPSNPIAIYLMTNEKMTENKALYERIGYVPFDRRAVDGTRACSCERPSCETHAA